MDYNNWIEIFVEAGNFIANYENSAKSKSNDYFNLREDELRNNIFEKDNMRKLAEYMFNVNDFDFKDELEFEEISVDLLTPEEKGLFAKKIWSRVNQDTKLPDIPDWYAWVFLKFESNESLLPAVSIKDYILKQRLMFTLTNYNA
ncbi:MAG TPA: hypothetical protein DCZ23_00240 [Lachnospiraceae bacterium]|nr:hypothetical protein [Lachnospiraceae bacterium]